MNNSNAASMSTSRDSKTEKNVRNYEEFALYSMNPARPSCREGRVGFYGIVLLGGSLTEAVMSGPLHPL